MFRFCCWFRRVKGVEVLLLVWWGNEEVDEKQLPSSLSLSLAAFLRWGEVGELTNQVVWMEGDANMA